MPKGRPKKYTGPRPIPLHVQAGILRRRFPESDVVATRDRIRWRGELTPSEYSDTYEVVIDHSLREKPLIYVVRPQLERVDNKRIPHVFAWNTLCLHTEDRLQIASKRLADTVVPWASEWLFFYEIWLATGGEWMGGGIHPAGGGALSAPERESATIERKVRLRRLTDALLAFYGSDDIEELLYNARL